MVLHANLAQGGAEGSCLPVLATPREHRNFPICVKKKGLSMIGSCFGKTYGCSLAQLIIKIISWEAAYRVSQFSLPPSSHQLDSSLGLEWPPSVQ